MNILRRISKWFVYSDIKPSKEEVGKDMVNLLLFVILGIAIAVLTWGFAHGQTMTQQQRESLLDYCFQHADRPNPIDDLIDKGFLSSSFRGENCLSVNEAHEKEEIRMNEELMSQQHQQEAINKENQAKIDRYHICMQNKTNEECIDILGNDDSSDPYNDCMQNRSTTWEECQTILMGNRTN